MAESGRSHSLVVQNDAPNLSYWGRSVRLGPKRWQGRRGLQLVNRNSGKSRGAARSDDAIRGAPASGCGCSCSGGHAAGRSLVVDGLGLSSHQLLGGRRCRGTVGRSLSPVARRRAKRDARHQRRTLPSPDFSPSRRATRRNASTPPTPSSRLRLSTRRRPCPGTWVTLRGRSGVESEPDRSLRHREYGPRA